MSNTPHPSKQKLAHLRAAMKEKEIDALIIPDTDPHLGEYIPDNWRIIEWLTGFTGSAGIVVITQTFAGLWTDSRYILQSEEQLAGSGFILMKPPVRNKNEINQWLMENLQSGSVIGVDGRAFSVNSLRKLETEAGNLSISIDIECDIISDLWTDWPQLPVSMALDLDISFCGKDRSVKMKEVRDEMAMMNVDYHLLVSPDDIMWLLNIRGNDVKFSPLLLSFAILDSEQLLLFTDEGKIPYALASEFDRLGIVILPYDEISGMITTLPAEASILISPATTSAILYSSIPKGMKIREDISIPSRLKAVKNRVEIANIRKIMIRDGVALTRFFYWMEKNLGIIPMSEVSLTEKLNQLRSEQDNFLGLSFPTITAYNDHAAFPHYSAVAATDSIIGQGGILLFDSGSQYLDGTTDITRTISLGNPTLQQKRDFTMVLKGMISLATVKFPLGTFGYQLDILARKALWNNGLNYGHGSGHGVGFCLNVHEGPQSISPVAGNDPRNYIRPGVLISDEPAIYRKGEYGIRTENLIVCYEDEETDFGRFLRFDTVSLCYIDTSLIEKTLLDAEELLWFNNYHTEVYEKLSPHLTLEEKDWLKEKTEPI
jgi:Xaa-Pro aminopeptidase